MVSFGVIMCSNRFNELTFDVIKSIELNCPDEFIIIDDSINNISKGRGFLYSGGGRGLGHCRNLGLQSTKSDYVLFADDDDIWFNCKLQNLKNLIINKPDCDFILHSSLIYDYAQNSVVGEINSERFERFKDFGHVVWRNWLTYKMPISNSSCWCVRASVAKSHKFDERVKRGVDGNFWKALMNIKALDIVWLDKNLVYYGINHGSERITETNKHSSFRAIVGDYYNLEVIRHWSLYPAKLLLILQLLKKVMQYFIKYKV